MVAFNATAPVPLKLIALAVISPVIEKSLALANCVAVLAFPVKAPVNPLAVNIPVFGLYVKSASVSAPC